MKYQEAADLFIDNVNIGVNCTLVYPDKRTECPNCKINTIGGSSINVYKTGGPYPFTVGNCQYCQGKGFKTENATEDIRLRIYQNPKNWIKVANIEIVAGRVQVIGYLSDSQKLRRAKEIELVSDQDYQKWKYKLATDIYPHGFGKNRYFLSYLDRI